MRRLLQNGPTKLEILVWHERRPADSILTIRDTWDALQLLSRFLGDPLPMTALRTTLADRNVSSDVSRLGDQEVLRQLAWQIARGHIVVASQALAVHGGGSATEPAEPTTQAAEAAEVREFAKTPAPEPVRETLTWIEFEMVDEEGAPVAGAKYEAVLPDGSTRRGSLDANGKARFDSIAPGTCQIRFPDFDGASWGAA